MSKRAWTVMWIIVLTVIILFFLTGCVKITDVTGKERIISYGLVEVSEGYGDGKHVIVYDPQTLICYITVSSVYKYGISPYYILGADGKPEIAVYGVNYGVIGVNDK